ncbi:MAG: hypothetical protein QG635_2131, partial [Bacteroidota bacterium]|nr:hypothetical protein [Bacteroidota bacterium]
MRLEKYIILIIFLLSCISSFGQDTLQIKSLEDMLDMDVNAASKYSQKIRETAASVSIISYDQIERYGWRTLHDALISIRSIYGRNDRS